jgi:hypothetical protein
MALSKWAANERMLWRLSLRGQVQTQEETNHMKALEQIGFLFEARTTPVNNTARNAATWMSKYQEMIEYESVHGTYHPGNKNEVPLARWVDLQRNAYKEYQNFTRMFSATPYRQSGRYCISEGYIRSKEFWNDISYYQATY